MLGQRVPRLKVLFLALEDTEYRLSDRLKKQTAGMYGAIPTSRSTATSTSCTDWSPLSEHGLADLREAIDREGYNLVIVDTFSRILGRGDQMDQQEMTRIMAALQRLAADHQAAILLVDHHRKSARTTLDADPIDDILGSTAKAGVVDCAMGLYRRHNEDEAKLKLSGRDFGDSELAIEWDPNAFCWNLKQGRRRDRRATTPCASARPSTPSANWAAPRSASSSPISARTRATLQPAAEPLPARRPRVRPRPQRATNTPSCPPHPSAARLTRQPCVPVVTRWRL